jgi:uncharacterized protein
MHLSAIYTYPVKSCAATSHTHIDLDRYGLIGDRRWMIVEPSGDFITQREYPRMATIVPTITDNGLTLSAPEMTPIHITPNQSPVQVRVWRSNVAAQDEGDTVAQWLSDYLHLLVRLVRVGEGYSRLVIEPPYTTRTDQETTFTDGYPVLIATEASLAALNDRLVERGAEPVPMSRFRPNLVIAGATPFAEDTWSTVQIGSLQFDVVKPCARCVMTTVDQQTGTIPDSAEPLATLNTFRKQNGKVMFAQNAIHHAPGSLYIGDSIAVQSANS